MDTFVKGENEMWKIPTKIRIQTRIVSLSISGEDSDGLTFAQPPT